MISFLLFQSPSNKKIEKDTNVGTSDNNDTVSTTERKVKDFTSAETIFQQMMSGNAAGKSM